MKKYIVTIALLAVSAVAVYAAGVCAAVDYPCSNCKGSGKITFNGQPMDCNWCHGTGRRAN